jgi:hypothetical protein
MLLRLTRRFPSSHSPKQATSAILAIIVSTMAALVPTPGEAQLVQNPRTVEFNPSGDHNTTLPDGSAAVSRYDFEVYMAGATAPFHTVDLGKPAPGTDGKIRVDFSSQVASWPLPGGTYESRVSAVGPRGVGRSDASNQFEFPTGCTYSLSATTLSLGASSGSSTVSVVTQAGCAWTATNPTAPNWVTLGTTSGSGNGTVSFTYTANPSSTARTLTLSVAGNTLTLNQAGAACTYAVSPTSFSLAATASTGNSSAVTTPTGCAWTATTTASWLTLTTATGSGNGNVVFSAQANPSSSARSAAVTVGGQTITVSQAGITCTYSVSPASLSLGAAAGSTSVTVTAPAGCSWTASTTTPWLSPATTAGSGTGSVSITYQGNTTTASRSGSLTIAGQTVAVVQAAVTPPAAPQGVRVIAAP